MVFPPIVRVLLFVVCRFPAPFIVNPAADEAVPLLVILNLVTPLAEAVKMSLVDAPVWLTIRAAFLPVLPPSISRRARGLPVPTPIFPPVAKNN